VIVYAVSETLDATSPPYDISKLPIEWQWIADQHITVGKKWADIYADTTLPPDGRAAIVLNGPARYLESIESHPVPEAMARWTGLLALSQALVNSAPSLQQWPEEASVLDKLQLLVSEDKINPDYRLVVAHILSETGKLLVRSLHTYIPEEDVDFYETTAFEMELGLRARDQPWTLNPRIRPDLLHIPDESPTLSIAS